MTSEYVKELHRLAREMDEIRLAYQLELKDEFIERVGVLLRVLHGVLSGDEYCEITADVVSATRSGGMPSEYSEEMNRAVLDVGHLMEKEQRVRICTVQK